MKLRIISGLLKGRNLTLGGAAENFRPTSEKNRGAVANILGDRIEGAVVGDFCAGSGAFGFEMLSRGARQVHFVENTRKRIEAIEKHIADFGVLESCRVYYQEIDRFVKRCSFEFDIIFFDPPYDSENLLSCVPSIAERLKHDGVLIVERRKQADARKFAIEPWDRREYGDTVMEFFSRPKQGTE